MSRLDLPVILFAAAGLLASAAPASATIQDFSGPPAGTIAAGTLPGGGTAPGTLFPDFTLSVVNSGGGPQSLLIFDSANPTGGDPDLGTPNQDFGGPGIGNGGKLGMPGANSVPYGNLLIVAEDIVDTTPLDGIVDDPDDEAGGGTITIEFDAVVTVLNVVVIDIDQESADFTLEDDGTLKGNVNATDLGDNSAQTLDLSSYGAVTCLEITFSGSGGIAQIEYLPASTPVESTTWGGLKKSSE